MSPQDVHTNALPAESASSQFDIDATVAAFLACNTDGFIELPRLSTGQRKQARKLVEQHPELVCESFGFGEERRLHLFKKETHFVRTRTPKVAPTVEAIIACVVPEDEHVQASTSPTCQDGIQGRVIDEMPMLPLSKRQSQDEDEVSTPTSASDTCQSSCDSSPAATTILDLPVRFHNVPCRNTFVHFEEFADERQVQSMPHGMFSRSLLAECSAELHIKASVDSSIRQSCISQCSFSRAEVHTYTVSQAALPNKQSFVDAPVPIAKDSLIEEFPLCPGTEVIIDGLLKLPAFNGLSGVVQSFDEEAGRYSVLLASQIGGHQWTKVKHENLRCSMPPPPSHDAVLLLDICSSEELATLDFPSTPTGYDEISPTAQLILAALV